MKKLYHVYLAEDFPLDLKDCALVVAESSFKAENFGREIFAERIESEPELEVCAYEVNCVDGYKIMVVKE